MASLHSILKCYRQATGVPVETTVRTGAITVDMDTARAYLCELVGPLRVADDPDVRIFLQHRTLEDSPETVVALVQDADDDAWLNSDAVGTTRYQTDRIFYISKEE